MLVVTRYVIDHKKWFLIALGALIGVWILLIVLDVANVGQFQGVWFGPKESAAVVDSDNDGVADSQDSAPENAKITLTNAEVTATAVAQATETPTPSPTPVATVAPSPTAVPTALTAPPTVEPTTAPELVFVCSDSRQVSDPALCAIPQQTVPTTQPVVAAPAQVPAPLTQAAMPRTKEEARVALNVSPEVVINSIDHGWYFTTLPAGTEFALSLPVGACVDFDPLYEKTGSKQMLPKEAYGEPVIDTERNMRVLMAKPAVLEHISVATVRWNVPCTK